MKVVRIIARLNVGGPAKHVAWLTEGLESADCETLLVAGTVPPGEDDMGYFAKQLGITPITIPEMSREISPKDLVTIWKLFRLLVRERPDIIHTHTAKAGTVGRVAGFLYRWSSPAVLLGRPRRCKLVHTYHGHIFHSYYGAFKTFVFLSIERILARMATDRIVVISDQQRAEINGTFRIGRPQQFKVISLGLDASQFLRSESRRHIMREEFGINRDDVLVGIVGRLTAIKNHDLFLRAVSMLKPQLDSSHRRVRFMIVGDGELRSELKRLTERLGLSDEVIFAGNRSDPENFYAAFDIVALTSRNEGTPLTLIEAMANSRPVISTAVGGVVDLLGNADITANDPSFVVCERGVSVARNDPAAFAQGLMRLISDVPLRKKLAENARQFVERHYSKDRLLADLSALYRELLQPDGQTTVAKSAERNVESRV
jgi:glycosyltransferase involved in cell wall biosynthesis